MKNVETYSELCESWVIYSIKKQKAIEEDLYAKNHSLKADVIILSESLQNYDDITFFKGASIFKNFYNYIGPELFFKGLKNLFKSNKGGTINYEKFKETYKNLSNEREYKEDPVKFIDPFIVKSGINQVECVYELENEQISKCVIKQSSNGILHIHHDYNYITDICVVGKDDNETILKDVKIFNNEINELIGVKQPKCIILNINDSSYFVQKFDESTLNYLMNTYIKISVSFYYLKKSSSKRILIAREIYEMVRSCNLSVQKFQKFCFNMMDTEEDQIVLEFIIETLIHSIENYTPLEYQHKLKEQLLNYIVDNYFTKFIQIKNTVVSVLCDLVEYNDISKLNDILSLLQILKNNKLMKLQSEEITSSQKLIDLDLSGVNLANRKKLLLLIFESSHLDMTLKNQYLDKILIEDEIDSDLKYILEASLPNNKSEIWGKLIDSNLNERRSLYIKMKGFNRKSQYSLIKSFLLNKFFDDFMSVKENRSLDYTLRFLRGLSPKDVIDKDVVTKFKNLRMKMNKKDHAIIYDLDKSKHFYY